MNSELSSRLKDPKELLSACQTALPSWSGTTMDTFTCTKLTGGNSSPGLYLVSSSAQGATPSSAVVKLDVESQEHPFYQFYQVLKYVHDLESLDFIYAEFSNQWRALPSQGWKVRIICP